MRRVWGVFALVLALAPLAAGAAEKSRLLVVSLKVEDGVSASAARLLNETLLARVQRDKRFEVFGESDLAAMLSAEETRQRAGCEDSSACLSELGGALGAERVIFGSLGKLGEKYVLNLKVIQVKEARVEARWSDSVDGDESELLSTVETAVTALLSEVVVGKGAAGPVTAVSEDAAADDAASSPFYKRGLFWGAVGVAVVALGVGAYVLLGDGGNGGDDPDNQDRAVLRIGGTLPTP
jgi:hypothetical protein